MASTDRSSRHIGALLALVAASPLLIWTSLAWTQGMLSASDLAALVSHDLYYQWWLAISLGCLLLSVACFSGAAGSVRGSSALFYGVLFVTLVSAAGLFIHTVVLVPAVVLAYRRRVLVPSSSKP